VRIPFKECAVSDENLLNELKAQLSVNDDFRHTGNQATGCQGFFQAPAEIQHLLLYEYPCYGIPQKSTETID